MTTPKNPAWPRVWVRFRRWNDEVHYEKPENANHNDFEMISLAEHEAIVSERVREARADAAESERRFGFERAINLLREEAYRCCNSSALDKHWLYACADFLEKVKSPGPTGEGKE